MLLSNSEWKVLLFVLITFSMDAPPLLQIVAETKHSANFVFTLSEKCSLFLIFLQSACGPSSTRTGHVSNVWLMRMNKLQRFVALEAFCSQVHHLNSGAYWSRVYWCIACRVQLEQPRVAADLGFSLLAPGCSRQAPRAALWLPEAWGCWARRQPPLWSTPCPRKQGQHLHVCCYTGKHATAG